MNEKPRPPYVSFERRAVDTVDEKGHPVAVDVDYAMITPVGSKDRIERVVKDWFPMCEDQVAQGRFEREWLTAYKNAYAAWKEGQELPLNGYPIRNWSVLTPSQAKNLTNLRVLTLEDLAQANAETISRLGMGALTLQQQARDFLKSMTGEGQLVQELAALRRKTEDLTQRNEALEKAVAEFKAAAKAEAAKV